MNLHILQHGKAFLFDMHSSEKYEILYLLHIEFLITQSAYTGCDHDRIHLFFVLEQVYLILAAQLIVTVSIVAVFTFV